MTYQRGLFGLQLAATRARQGELFDQGGRVSSLSCEQCGEAMEYTPGGYLACPNNHGRLKLAVVPEEEPSGLWFEEDGPWNS
jgi:hypothetical protein